MAGQVYPGYLAPGLHYLPSPALSPYCLQPLLQQALPFPGPGCGPYPAYPAYPSLGQQEAREEPEARESPAVQQGEQEDREDYLAELAREREALLRAGQAREGSLVLRVLDRGG
jgi:hypothetical protein